MAQYCNTLLQPNTMTQYCGPIPQPNTAVYYCRPIPWPNTTVHYHSPIPQHTTTAKYCGLIPLPNTAAHYHSPIPWPNTTAQYHGALPWGITMTQYHGAQPQCTTKVQYHGALPYQSCRSGPMTKYDHGNYDRGSTQLWWTCLQQIEPYKACAEQVQSKKCYYLWLIQYNRYQSCRSGPMTKYDHRNYDCRSAQPRWTCPQQIVPYKACAGQVQSKKCYYLHLIQ